MATLFTQTDERMDMDQPFTLHVITPLPAAGNQKADMLFDETTGQQERPAYWDGNEWVDMGYGFHKAPSTVPGTDHKELLSFTAFGYSSKFVLTPFGVAAMRHDGSGKVAAISDDVIGGDQAQGGFVWARNAPDGARWDLSMYEIDAGGPNGRGGAILQLEARDNSGIDPVMVMTCTREDEGRVQMETNFRLPRYQDLFGNGPVNPLEGDMAYDLSSQQSYTWNGSSWI